MTALIRLYQPADRMGLRQLCGETAERGAPTTCPDRELLADLVSLYYTDHEPSHCWVAVDGPTLVGYLSGCLDSAHWRRQMRSIVPAALGRALGRRSFWRVLVWAIGRATQRSAPTAVYAQYPAHLHLNVALAHRGRGLGRQLLTAFEGQVRAAGLSGIHANVRVDNAGGRETFLRLGFSIIVPPAGSGGSVVYGKRLSP